MAAQAGADIDPALVHSVDEINDLAGHPEVAKPHAQHTRKASSKAWLATGLLFAIGAIVAWPFDRSAVDWQPGLVASEPWRAWSAAFVHLSALHLGANLAGVAMVIAFGMAAGLGSRDALAWLLAWPLTQLSLLLQPELLHYGGLSGVLHAGVTVVSTLLLIDGTRRQRWVAAATLAVVAAKIAREAPWAGPLIHPAGWDIAVVPLAHAGGALAGVAMALLIRATCGPEPQLRMRDTRAVVE